MDIYDLLMGVHALGIFFMFGELVYVTQQKPSELQGHMEILLISMILMFCGYYVELKATSGDVAYMGTIIAYMGKPFILLYGFLIVCDFYNKFTSCQWQVAN